MDVYLGQLMLVPYNFAPRDWAFCHGQTLLIARNTALFSLLGTYYGGNGTSTFGLPDLRGATPVGMGGAPGLSDYVLGETGGVRAVSLDVQTVPPHVHAIEIVAPQRGLVTSASPAGALLSGNESNVNFYVSGAPATNLNAATLSPQPGFQSPHENRMPYQVLNWIICLSGIFPPRP